MSTAPTSHCAVDDIESSTVDRTALRQRSRRLGRLVFAIIIIACTAAAAAAWGRTSSDKSPNDGHPNLRQRIACMC